MTGWWQCIYRYGVNSHVLSNALSATMASYLKTIFSHPLFSQTLATDLILLKPYIFSLPIIFLLGTHFPTSSQKVELSSMYTTSSFPKCFHLWNTFSILYCHENSTTRIFSPKYNVPEYTTPPNRSFMMLANPSALNIPCSAPTNTVFAGSSWYDGQRT